VREGFCPKRGSAPSKILVWGGTLAGAAPVGEPLEKRTRRHKIVGSHPLEGATPDLLLLFRTVAMAWREGRHTVVLTGEGFNLFG